MCATAIGIAAKDSATTVADAPATVPSLRELRLRWAEDRRSGPDFGAARRRLQRVHDRLAQSGEAGGLTRIERNAAALRVAVLNRNRSLVEYYRDQLVRLAADSDIIAVAAAAAANPVKAVSMRLGAILGFVDAVADDPRRLRQAHIRALSDQGLTTDGISALARLVAFHGYQSDLLADAVSAASLDPRDLRR